LSGTLAGEGETVVPRVWLGNFDFEHSLADTRVTPRARVRQVARGLTPILLGAAADGDFVWCPDVPPEGFFERLACAGLAAVTPVWEPGQLPTVAECVPWGWTAATIDWARRSGLSCHAPPLEVVRRLNSRQFALELEQQLGVGLRGAGTAASLTELFDVVDGLSGSEHDWVVKAEFAHSSRERIVHRRARPVTRDDLTGWAGRRLRAGGKLVIEPWVERIDEVGIQLAISESGEPELAGVSGLLVDEAGRFVGCDFTPGREDDPRWADAVSAALEVGRRARDAGYFGPLGVDAMRYRGAGSEPAVRPLQDINARWTMGRLSLGFRRLLGPGEQGRLLVGAGARRELRAGGWQESRSRIISLTPEGTEWGGVIVLGPAN
jgi:hypothetical protein